MSDSTMIGHSILDNVEIERIDPIYGWRYYSFDRCKVTDSLAIRGLYGMCVHSSLSPEAVCRKGAYKALCSSELQPTLDYDTPEHAVPDKDCTCGYYILYEPMEEPAATKIAVWSQAIGKTQLSEFGARTRQVRLIAAFLPSYVTELGSVVLVEGIKSTFTTLLHDNLGLYVATKKDAPALLKLLNIPFTVEQIYPPILDAYYDE